MRTLPVLLVALGGGLTTAVLDLAGLRVGATPAELVLWCAVGALFSRIFATAPLVVAIPLLLAGIELAAGSGGAAGPAEAGDPLSLAFPGGHALPLDQLVFAAAYVAWARAFGLRTGATLVVVGPVLLVSVLNDGALPVFTLLAVALLVPNSDRLARLLREG